MSVDQISTVFLKTKSPILRSSEPTMRQKKLSLGVSLVRRQFNVALREHLLIEVAIVVVTLRGDSKDQYTQAGSVCSHGRHLCL